jgi:hypothetical protein
MIKMLGLAVLLICWNAAAQIPAVSGTTLSGEKVSLPQDQRGGPAVLVLGFSQASREQAKAWGKRLAVDFREQPEVRFYEVPMLGGVPKFLRGLVVKKIAQDVSENGKHHFLPVYDHEPEWRALAGYAKADDAYVVLIDGNGKVRWKTEGPLSDAADAELRQKVIELRQP